jgi:hypothetical protein
LEQSYPSVKLDHGFCRVMATVLAQPQEAGKREQASTVCDRSPCGFISRGTDFLVGQRLRVCALVLTLGRALAPSEERRKKEGSKDYRSLHRGGSVCAEERVPRKLRAWRRDPRWRQGTSEARPDPR